MSGFTLDVSVVCQVCGEDLFADLNRHAVLEVRPCVRCVERARSRGYETGSAHGKSELKEKKP
jgi:hypothetical protein